MKFVSMKKVNEGKFLSRYDIVYETVDGGVKNYEMVSRAKNRTQFDQLHDHKPEAVIMIMHDPSGEKLLINREFRLAMGEFIYNFPAGLVDDGEDLDTSAARELREETGLKLVRIDEWMKESYSAEGICDEMGVVCVGVAEGNPSPAPTQRRRSWRPGTPRKKYGSCCRRSVSLDVPSCTPICGQRNNNEGRENSVGIIPTLFF